MAREEDRGAVRFSVEVPRECPAFAGHFPGRPILPGVAQLALVEEGIARLRVERSVGSMFCPALTEISGLRFRRPMGPGEKLELRLLPVAAANAFRFELRAEGSVATGGSAQLGGGPEPEAAMAGSASGPAHSGDSRFAPIRALGRVPHAPPALLVESLMGRDERGARGIARIPAASPFVVAGVAPSYLGLELAAQTAALVEAVGREEGDEEKGAPREGYLVASRNARFFVPSLPAEESLDVILAFAGSASPLAMYEVRIERSGAILVEGTISTWIAEPVEANIGSQSVERGGESR